MKLRGRTATVASTATLDVIVSAVWGGSEIVVIGTAVQLSQVVQIGDDL